MRAAMREAKDTLHLQNRQRIKSWNSKMLAIMLRFWGENSEECGQAIRHIRPIQPCHPTKIHCKIIDTKPSWSCLCDVWTVANYHGPATPTPPMPRKQQNCGNIALNNIFIPPRRSRLRRNVVGFLRHALFALHQQPLCLGLGGRHHTFLWDAPSANHFPQPQPGLTNKFFRIRISRHPSFPLLHGHLGASNPKKTICAWTLPGKATIEIFKRPRLEENGGKKQMKAKFRRVVAKDDGLANKCPVQGSTT